MATNASGTPVPPEGRRSDGQVPIRVYDCSRLGLQANPPDTKGPFGGLRRRR